MVKMNFYTGSVGDKEEDAANPGWIMGGSSLVDHTKPNYPPTTTTSERKMTVVKTTLQEVRVVDLTKANKIKVGVQSSHNISDSES